MIASINGKVARTTKDSLIIVVGGIGIQVFTTTDLCSRMTPGEFVSLHTHLVVREDSLSLYGFESQDSLEIFILLLGVNGIGPRIGLSILSILSPEAIRRAVINEQIDIFARVPGIGRKTAQKILLHLQDRIKPGLDDLEPIATLSELDGDLLGALTGLGYSVIEAQAAIQYIPRGTSADLETRLRLALQYFSK